MNNKKNIEQLFQEKLKTFQAQPAPEVWERIAFKLENKKRKPIPVWWFYGTAAILIIGFFISVLITKNNSSTTPNQTKITVSPQPNTNLTNSKIIKDSFKFKITAPKTTPSNSKIFNNSNTHIAAFNTLKTPLKQKIATQQQPIKTKNKPIISNLETNKLVNQDSKITTDTVEKQYSKITKSKNNIKKSNTLVKLKQNKNPKTIAKRKTKRWEIAPVFAVINSNSFSNDSPVDANLSSNKKNGNTTFAYGVKIAYQLNTRWTVQSGIQLQELSYTTNNIAVVINSSIDNANNKATAINGISFINNSSVNFINVESTNLASSSSNTNLTQNYGYVEIPLEAKYAFIKTKAFKTQLVAGLSTLFLNKNELNTESNTVSQNLGKANNLNPINFSGNVGVELNYKLNAKWQLHLNPMFKAQLNTFSKNGNGFTPFILGVYSGIKYKF